MSNSSSNSIAGGMFWAFGERILAQLVSTVVGIVLARILSPDEYGIISIVMIFINICNVFVTSGFGTALVRKINVDAEDYDTAFTMSFILSLILYALLFVSAPYIAAVYDNEVLSPVLRVLGLKIIISSLSNIQQAHVQREMAFRKFFFATITGTVLSCGVGLVMAFMGYGVWALVFQYLTNTVVDAIFLSLVSGWNPRLRFFAAKAKEIFSFGWKVLGANLISTAENDIRSLIVGYKFGSAELAFFDQGKKYPSLLITNINSAVGKVMLPALAKEQENKEQYKRMLRKTVSMEMYLLTPFMLGFLAVAEGFVHVVLTDKWLAAVPFIQIFCIAYLTRPMETTFHQSLLALGRSGLVMAIITVINVVAVISVLVAVFVFESVLMIAVLYLLTTLVSLACFMAASHFVVGYTIKEQLKDILPSIAIGAIMCLAVSMVGKLQMGELLSLLLQVLTGALVYILLSAIFKLEQYAQLKKKLLSRRKKNEC
jgi:O-antigen/teichoic acid export membrane protein